MNTNKNKQHAPRPRRLPAAVALALLAIGTAAQAQQGDMQKVEVTGSSIKRSIADQPLPVTVVKA